VTLTRSSSGHAANPTTHPLFCRAPYVSSGIIVEMTATRRERPGDNFGVASTGASRL
jgi:hypothetical protein